MSGGCEEEAKKAPGGGRFPFWSRISNCKQIRTLTESLDLFPHRKKNCLYVQYVTAILQLLSSHSGVSKSNRDRSRALEDRILALQFEMI